MSDELVARMDAARQTEMILTEMFDVGGWVLESCSEFRVTAYPAKGGQLITLVAPSWERLREVVIAWLSEHSTFFPLGWEGATID
jgi:hypothetical protein